MDRSSSLGKIKREEPGVVLKNPGSKSFGRERWLAGSGCSRKVFPIS